MDAVDAGRQAEFMDLDYLAQIGLDDRLAVWQERCQIVH